MTLQEGAEECDVDAVVAVVTSAVEGLVAERVSVSDSTGRPLTGVVD